MYAYIYKYKQICTSMEVLRKRQGEGRTPGCVAVEAGVGPASARKQKEEEVEGAEGQYMLENQYATRSKARWRWSL